MYSHEHASLSKVLFNDRCEYACLDEWCFITCLLEPFCAYVSALKGYDDMMLGLMLGYMMSWLGVC